MERDTTLWEKYTDDNEKKIQDKSASMIYHFCVCLGATKICEAGCNVGNNLIKFPFNYEVYGLDMSDYALEKARKKFPSFKFIKTGLEKISFPDSYVDLVFTRGVLIHIKKDSIYNVMEELLRISKKWIFNLEYYGSDGEMINWKRGTDLLWYRNMKELWKKFDVDIISDTEIPADIDSGKMHLTLVRKKN